MRVMAVSPKPGHVLWVRFEDGSERTIDVRRFLRGPVFDEIRADRAHFEAVSVDRELGVVAWPNGADIDSDVLYGLHEPAWVESASTRSR